VIPELQNEIIQRPVFSELYKEVEYLVEFTDFEPDDILRLMFEDIHGELPSNMKLSNIWSNILTDAQRQRCIEICITPVLFFQFVCVNEDGVFFIPVNGTLYGFGLNVLTSMVE